MSDERTHWSLFHTGHHVVCTEYAAPGGREVRISYNNLPIAVQRYARAEDAALWAKQLRSRWEGIGKPAGVAVSVVDESSAVTSHPRIGVAIPESHSTRPFAWGLSKSNTLLNASATSWFGLESAWRAFCC
jgi:hypothetical protein